MADYLFVLGSPNGPDGVLSETAQLRLKTAIDYWRKNRAAGTHFIVVPTGGFGEHFNQTSTPHWQYARRMMFDEGLPDNAIAEEGLESGNTVEDVEVIACFLDKAQCSTAVVVTSQSHVERCDYIFRCLAPEISVGFIPAPDPKDCDLQTHEDLALVQLRRQGGVVRADTLHRPSV